MNIIMRFTETELYRNLPVDSGNQISQHSLWGITSYTFICLQLYRMHCV